MSQRFNTGDAIWHLRSKTIYFIKGTPDVYRLEATNEPAYLYMGMPEDDKPLPPIWVRSQKEMEDGRFIMFEDAPP
jgi:hypothetical protein